MSVSLMFFHLGALAFFYQDLCDRVKGPPSMMQDATGFPEVALVHGHHAIATTTREGGDEVMCGNVSHLPNSLNNILGLCPCVQLAARQ